MRRGGNAAYPIPSKLPVSNLVPPNARKHTTDAAEVYAFRRAGTHGNGNIYK